MGKKVISRDHNHDGKVFKAGTDLDKLPTSAIGWLEDNGFVVTSDEFDKAKEADKPKADKPKADKADKNNGTPPPPAKK